MTTDWNPHGPLTRGQEGGTYPLPGPGQTVAGNVPLGIARAPAAIPVGGAGVGLPLDPLTGALRVSSSVAPVVAVALAVAIDGVVGANQTLIPAPGAALRISIWHLTALMRGPGTMKFHEGGGLAITGTFTTSGTPPPGGTQVGWAFDAPGGIYARVLALNESLQVDVSAAAVGIDGMILYTLGP